MPSSRRVRRIAWLGGLVLVLALLGHDVLMAAAAHTASESPAAIHELNAPNHAADGVAGMVHREPAPKHQRDCGATGDAIPAAGPELDLAGIPADASGHDRQVSALSVARNWVEPLWPPGARRAVLQIYRI